MTKIFFLKQSSIQRGLQHIEGYIERALHAVEDLSTVALDLVTGVRNIEGKGASQDEILSRFRDYIVRTIVKEKPDAVLFMNGYSIDKLFPGIFKQLSDMHVRLFAWHADDPYYFDLQEPFAQFFDTILTVDSGAVDFWKPLCRNVHFLPLAFAPESVVDLWKNGGREKYKSDVCFVGTPFAGSNRVKLIDQNAEFLAKLDFRLIGASAIDSWEHNLKNAKILKSQISDSFVSSDEALCYVLASKCNLNIHKDCWGHAWDRNSRSIEARSPNERFFAFGGTGAFQLVDDTRSDLSTMFPEEALATFDHNLNESFVEKIRYYLDHESEREQKATVLKEIILTRHTYDHRIQFILNLV